MNKLLTLICAGLFLAGCGKAAAPPVGQAEAAVDYAAAVANPARPEADRGRDAGRKPAAVLEFFGIGPGMQVLDMFSGGGYYTEILAHLVGADGAVTAHSNSAYLQFVGDEFRMRHADNRLPNVTVLMAENNELALEAGQFDAIALVLGYHDIYWVAPERGWPEFDGEALRAELYKSLKPGGIVGVVDHRAEPGAPADTGGSVHRIDRDIVVADFEAAGFVLEAESDLLHNPDDDRSVLVFDPSVRGKTDRFVLRFRKPE